MMGLYKLDNTHAVIAKVSQSSGRDIHRAQQHGGLTHQNSDDYVSLQSDQY